MSSSHNIPLHFDPEPLQFDKALFDLQLFKFDDAANGLHFDMDKDAPEPVHMRYSTSGPIVSTVIGIRSD